ncbi:MAG: hypothetical protein E5Y04_28360 [Mesorhizobium sp.]|uniref:hypothetical protein n=1 Tax=Mesorhizobium sp. M0088 TaxID=2956873 RepID=UPI0012044397|nr:MAG: hypothetical protein E5Y04_28360 [Mesorhizobium sp.]
MSSETSSPFAAAREDFDDVILAEYLRGKTQAELDEMAEAGLGVRKEKFNEILVADAEFYLLYRCANIAASWLSLLAGALIEDFNELPNESKPLDEQVAALAFFSRLANDLWAIIELSEIGFDLQARALTRGYLEHVDVLICCIHDKEVTKQFVNAVEPKDANAFWHKHVSKNKAKIKVSNLIANALGMEKTSLVDMLREDVEFAGSSLIHPTMLAGLSTAFGEKDGDYDSYPIFPAPIAASGGIFRAILSHLLWLWFAMGTLPKTGYGEWQAILQSDRMLDNVEIDKRSALYRRTIGFLLDHQLLMKVEEEDVTLNA